jgi:hypothetical protein
MSFNPIEAKIIAKKLGFNQAKVLIVNDSLLPLFCQDNRPCEISLLIPGGIRVNPQNLVQSYLEINNGSKITGCELCPRKRPL